MRFADQPAPPCERFAQALLANATMAGVDEIRFGQGDATMVILFDGKPQPAPRSDLFQPIVDAVMKFAGTSPATGTRSGRRLDVEFGCPQQRSSWLLELDAAGPELVLRRLRDNKE